jgi:hypothetical protein
VTAAATGGEGKRGTGRLRAGLDHAPARAGRVKQRLGARPVVRPRPAGGRAELGRIGGLGGVLGQRAYLGEFDRLAAGESFPAQQDAKFRVDQHVNPVGPAVERAAAARGRPRGCGQLAGGPACRLGSPGQVQIKKGDQPGRVEQFNEFGVHASVPGAPNLVGVNPPARLAVANHSAPERTWRDILEPKSPARGDEQPAQAVPPVWRPAVLVVLVVLVVLFLIGSPPCLSRVLVVIGVLWAGVGDRPPEIATGRDRHPANALGPRRDLSRKAQLRPVDPVEQGD